MKIEFEEVKYSHRAKDKNGKKKQKTFSQTINPWNKKKDGTPKTRSEIFQELVKEAEVWAKTL